jgi:hypothetical protein
MIKNEANNDIILLIVERLVNNILEVNTIDDDTTVSSKLLRTDLYRNNVYIIDVIT